GGGNWGRPGGAGGLRRALAASGGVKRWGAPAEPGGAFLVSGSQRVPTGLATTGAPMEQRRDELAQTADRAERTMIADLPVRLGSVVRVAGFVEAIRDQKRMQFLILHDRSGAVQIAHDKVGNPALAARIAALTIGSAVAIAGRCQNVPAVKLGAIEIAAEAMVVHSLAEAPLPIAADSA